MARPRGERQSMRDEEGAPHRSKYPRGEYKKRGSRDRAPDLGLPSLATAHDVMMLTRAERAALTDQDYDQSLQKLIAELDRARNLRAKGQLQARIEEMENERPAAKPVTEVKPSSDTTEPPPPLLRTIADTIKSPIPAVEPAPEPVSDTKHLESNTNNTPDPAVPDTNPTKPLSDLPRSSDITKDELRKILGDDYEAVMGDKPSEAAVPVVPEEVEQPENADPDVAPPLADLGVPTESVPVTPPVEVTPMDQPVNNPGRTAETKHKSIAELRSSWNEPLAVLSGQDETILQDLFRDLVPKPNEWVLDKISTYAKALKTETSAAQSTVDDADKQRLLRDAEMRRRKLLLLLATAEYRKLPVAGTPVEPELDPTAADVSARPEVTPDATPTPNPEFSPQETASLQDFGRIFAETTDEDREYAASEYDLLIRQLQEKINQTAKPVEQARLRHELNLARARRDLISFSTPKPRERQTTSSPSEAGATPISPDATPPGSPEHPEATEPHEPTPLEQARANAARALMKRGQIFGRVGDKGVEQSIVEYQNAIAADQRAKLDQIKQEYAGRDLSDTEVDVELKIRLAKFALSERFAEDTALREAMKSSGERSAGHRFKEFWRKNSGKRALIGLGLLGAGIATGGLASPVLGAAILGARVAMSSVGSTMMAEGGLQGLMEKKGRTKKLTAEQISHMDRAELRELLAAHIIRYGESGQGEFGTHTTRLLKKTWSDDTGKMLLAEYQLDQENEIRKYLQDHADETPDQIIAGVLDSSLDEQNRLHKAFAFERADDRLLAISKWIMSIGVGMITGATVALAGMDRLEHVRAAKSAAKSGLEHAGQPPHTSDMSHGAGAIGKTGSAVTETDRDTIGANNSALNRVLKRSLEHTTPSHETLLDSAGTEAGPNGPAVEAAQHAAERAASFKEVAHKGDSVWKLVTDQLHRRLGDNFDKLDPARRTYIIDSIKDRIVAHPQEFGLDDANQLAAGKEIDFTAAFEGPHAVNLPEVVSHAKELSQQAVDSITHNNEVIGQWMTTHPGEPINDTIIDHLIHGANIATPDTASPTAELLGASHDQVAAAFTDHMTQNAIQKSILDLANTNPELYARFHEVNPDCYPAVVGVTTETAAPAVESTVSSIELSSSHLNALGKGLEIIDKIPQTGSTREILHAIGDMKVTDAAKASALSVPLEKAGLDFRSARDVERVMRKVFMEIVGRVEPDTKVRNVLETINKKIA